MPFSNHSELQQHLLVKPHPPMPFSNHSELQQHRLVKTHPLMPFSNHSELQQHLLVKPHPPMPFSNHSELQQHRLVKPHPPMPFSNHSELQQHLLVKNPPSYANPKEAKFALFSTPLLQLQKRLDIIAASACQQALEEVQQLTTLSRQSVFSSHLRGIEMFS